MGLLLVAAYFFVFERAPQLEKKPSVPEVITPPEVVAEEEVIPTLPSQDPIEIPTFSSRTPSSQSDVMSQPVTEISVKEATSWLADSEPEKPSEPVLPPLEEAAIRRAVVKIECPTASGIGKYVGSGFSIPQNRIVTAAHVVMNSGSQTCSVIFPNADRRPVHYLRGELENLEDVRRRHDEEGVDVAILTLFPLESYPEAQAIFSKEYPAVPYSICENPQAIGDEILHFGYPSNFVDQNYLSQMDGRAVAHADITAIEDKLSLDGTFAYKNPVLVFSNEESVFHPYSVSRVATFYGDSGGLAFNATKQCSLGIHRSSTVGRTSGDNYSIFMNLGWEGARQLVE